MQRRFFIKTGIAGLAMSGCGAGTEQDLVLPKVPGELLSRDPNYLGKTRGALGSMRLAGELPYEDYSYQVMADPTSNAPTPVVERFELREGDCFIPKDCEMDKQRSEVQGTGAAYNLECKYQMWVYIPRGFHVFGTYCHVGLNLHAKNNNGTNNTALIMPLMGGDDRSTRWTAMIFNGKKRERYKLISYLQMVERWTKLVVHSKWHEDGFHKIYVNDDLVVNYNGYTLGQKTQSPFDLKYGLYRGGINRKKKQYNMKRFPDQVAYYSGVKMTKI